LTQFRSYHRNVRSSKGLSPLVKNVTGDGQNFLCICPDPGSLRHVGWWSILLRLRMLAVCYGERLRACIIGPIIRRGSAQRPDTGAGNAEHEQNGDASLEPRCCHGSEKALGQLGGARLDACAKRLPGYELQGSFDGSSNPGDWCRR
jgi:hypothetical protein